MNVNNTYKRFLQLKLITKYGIFGLAFISFIYCVLTFLGYYVPWMFIVFFSFAFVLRIILSKAFGLCWIHRSCILYNYCLLLMIQDLNLKSAIRQFQNLMMCLEKDKKMMPDFPNLKV